MKRIQRPENLEPCLPIQIYVNFSCLQAMFSFSHHFSYPVIWSLNAVTQLFKRAPLILQATQVLWTYKGYSYNGPPLHLSPPSHAVLARRKKISQQMMKWRQYASKTVALIVQTINSSNKTELRAHKATPLEQKDQSLSQLQPGFSVCLWNMKMIYLI